METPLWLTRCFVLFWKLLFDPWTLLIIAINGYLVYRILQRIRHQQTVSSHASSSPIPKTKEYTRSMWKQLFSSSSSHPLWLAVQGNIYDVSSAPHLYAKNGPYEKFLGHDCTLAFAKNSLDDKMFEEDYIEEMLPLLTSDEKHNLEKWLTTLSQKYPCIGHLQTSSSSQDH
jgi:predicted heme/steroid binding protein